MSKLEVLDKHIKEAEKLLLGEYTFDTLERVPFIKNLITCDLLAVPGSGKTTALLAKLYCLSKHLPFSDGSGILILAHTNSAVDEIEKKLKRHCPNLFDYPNFVGTIQSFVNKFLANSACIQKYNSYIQKNDNSIVNKYIQDKIKNNHNKAFYFISNIVKNRYNVMNESCIPDSIDNKSFFIKELQELKLLSNKKVFKFDYNTIINSDLTRNKKQFIFDFQKQLKSRSESEFEILKIIESIRYNEQHQHFTSMHFKNPLKCTTESGYELKEIFEYLKLCGYISFSDSYELANYEILQHPQICNYLQDRFSYVFIDEMQDLENFQIDLIDKIFFHEQSKTIIQRIGDKNQSIYNNVKESCDWITRAEVNPDKYVDLTLNKSMRLSPVIGKLVDSFVFERPSGYTVEGNFDIKSENIVPDRLISDVGIPPCLILIEQNTTGIEIKNKFEELILKYNLNNTDSGKRNGFKIVAWNTEWNEVHQQAIEGQQIKKRLKDYFPDYTKETHAKKEDFSCLMKHLRLFDNEKRTLELARKSILNAFIRVLSLEEIKIIKVIRGRSIKLNYTKQDLILFLKMNDEIYEEFKQKLFHWAFELATQKAYSEVYESIVGFINDELIKYDWDNSPNIKTNRCIEKAKVFIEQSDVSFHNAENENIECTSSNVNIDICSVHSVKGQTHCATMYMDSAYERPTYESEKLILKDTSNPSNNNSPLWLCQHSFTSKYAKQALKMMYVGFSRPTHLLCYVTFLENVNADLDKFKDNGWVVEIILQ